jgi:hypothetical protein
MVAAAAIDTLDSKHIWDGLQAPMVSRQQGLRFNV